MTSTLSPPDAEAIERFGCFGGNCAVLVQGPGPAGAAPAAAARAKRRLLDWHAQFSRFDPSSELSLLNRDPRACVPVSTTMLSFVEAAVKAAAITGGLVDPTLVGELEQAGYSEHLASPPVPLAHALRLASTRMPASPSPHAGWRQVSVDRRARTVTRPPGVRLDSGGIAKGLFGDVLASVLAGHGSYAVQAAGDIRLGGAAGLIRPVQVDSPFDEGLLHTFELAQGAAATSGIGKRSWLDRDGRPAHHLLDPASGTPAFTGVLQVTALAPSAVEAEALAKAALLSGAARATDWLRHGGLVVYDNGAHEVVDPNPREGLR
jgi:thiamine biosynthesis lipoprotein